MAVYIWVALVLPSRAGSTDVIKESDTGGDVDNLLLDPGLIVKANGAGDRRLTCLTRYSSCTVGHFVE
jgi:hypothetical protein